MDAGINDQEALARQQRGGALFEQLGIDLYPHPYLAFALPPGHRSAAINTDAEGFRRSDSPSGVVDTESWLAGGGGGLLLGSSVAFGFGASSDGATPASYLATLTGGRWLNLAVIAANSLQELIAAVPYLEAASTVVVFSGLGNYMAMLRTRLSSGSMFGPVLYEGTFAKLTQIPLFDLAELASGRSIDGAGVVPRPVPAAPEPVDLPARVVAAARMQLRDLAFLARTAREGTRVLFCLQPWASPRTRALTDEEKDGYDFGKSSWGFPDEILEDNLDGYADLLAKGCAELRVEFLNLSADRFVGRSFMTNAILTDEGNRQVAQFIHQALRTEI